MVNDSIADEVQRIHGLRERPVVVETYRIIGILMKAYVKGQQFCEQLGIPEDMFIVMYHEGNAGPRYRNIVEVDQNK